jgi:hypothetical protein
MRNSLVISLIIIAMLLGAVAGYYSRNNETSTEITTTTVNTATNQIITEFPSTTITRTLTLNQATTSSTMGNLPLTSIPIGTSISMNQSSSVEIFVRYYYYDPNKTFTIFPSNVTGLVFIWGANYTANIFTTDPNFTVRESSPNRSLVLGGRSNQSEGAIVGYEIHSSSNSNGTYDLGVQQLYPEYCATEFPLIVGSGSPNYNSNIMGGCIVWTEVGSNQLNPPEDQLLAQLVAVQNIHD